MQKWQIKSGLWQYTDKCDWQIFIENITKGPTPKNKREYIYAIVKKNCTLHEVSINHDGGVKTKAHNPLSHTHSGTH